MHELDNLDVNESKEVKTVSLERPYRAFHADRVSFELSNFNNGLAMKESDLMNLNAQFRDLNEQLEDVSKNLEDSQEKSAHLS